MSIENFITRVCVQTAVYWGSPTIDGFNKKTYANPIEIKCRWEDRAQLMEYGNEKSLMSRAVVTVLQDVDEDGVLFLGDFEDLIVLSGSDSADSSGTVGTIDPADIEGAFPIKRFEKIPAVGSATVFLRRAYLTPWLS